MENNEVGCKRTKTKTSNMDIDSEPMTKKPRTESPQGQISLFKRRYKKLKEKKFHHRIPYSPYNI